MSFARFIQDRRGAIAPMFGLLVVPLVGLTGAAVDYSRANLVRSAMQASLDATALALSKDVTGLTASQATQKANDYFKANFNRPEAANIVITATYTSNPSTLTVSGTGSVATTFMKVMGVDSMAINSTSTVTWGMTRLRVALVLDNTGSMASANKMTALKTAAKNLLAQLQAAASTNGDVYVSIIPFAKDVNVDPVNYSQTWVKFTGSSDTWDENNGSCSKSGGYNTKSACVAQNVCSISGHNTQSSCTSAGVCSNSSYTDQSSCTGDGTCSNSQYTTQKKCTKNNATWTPLYLDHRGLERRDLDAEQPQHLERLRDGPRPELRHDQHRALDRHPGDAVSGRPVRRLPGAADGAELQLVGDEQQDRRHAAQRQHQPGDRIAMGLPVADERPLHDPGDGSELHL